MFVIEFLFHRGMEKVVMCALDYATPLQIQTSPAHSSSSTDTSSEIGSAFNSPTQGEKKIIIIIFYLNFLFDKFFRHILCLVHIFFSAQKIKFFGHIIRTDARSLVFPLFE